MGWHSFCSDRKGSASDIFDFGLFFDRKGIDYAFFHATVSFNSLFLVGTEDRIHLFDLIQPISGSMINSRHLVLMWCFIGIPCRSTWKVIIFDFHWCFSFLSGSDYLMVYYLCWLLLLRSRRNSRFYHAGLDEIVRVFTLLGNHLGIFLSHTREV